MFPDHLWPTHGHSGPVFAWRVKNSRFLTQSLYQSVFLPCVFSSDFGWDRWAGHQNLSAPWCRLWRRRGVQGADQGPEGQTVGRHHKFWVLSMFPFSFFSLYWHLFHWCLRDCCRRVFPSLWLAPTSWSRWRGRRSVVVFTPGVLLRWRTPNTTTSSNYAPCLCEFDSKTPDNHSGIFLKIFTKPPFLLMETDCKTPAVGTDLCCRLVCV